jgi:hypothetical protein
MLSNEGKNTDTNFNIEYFFLVHGYTGYAEVPCYYVTPTLSVLLNMLSVVLKTEKLIVAQLDIPASTLPRKLNFF